MKLGRPIKYIAVKPEEVVKRVKKVILDVADTNVKMLESAESANVFKDLELLFKQGIENVDPANISGAFKGRNNIYDHVHSMLENAKKEVVIVTTADGLARKVENFKPILKKLSQKGIDVKVAAPLKTDNAKNAAKELKDFVKVKDINLNARFILIDNNQLMFMLSDDKNIHESFDSGIWVNSPFFANTMQELFSSAWGKA